MSKSHGGQWIARVSLIVLCVCMAGCAKRNVAIPAEWHSAPPAPVTEPTPRTHPEPRTHGSSDSQQFVLQAPPAIKEAEVPAPSGTGIAPPANTSAPQPQRLASLHLVDQAKTALAQGKRDAAISLFEQAVQVDVYNGEAFFGLARAWRLKGSRQKAVEFARKAEILFQDEPNKLMEVYLFESTVYSELGDKTREDIYRRKAARLRGPGKK